MKVVVVGGGYAGLGCLVELSRKLPGAERWLVDPGEQHLKLTRLHEALRTPLSRWQVPYAELERRYGFTHVRAPAALGKAALTRAAETGRIPLGDRELQFDVLLLAAGARPRPRPRLRNCFGLADLRHREGQRLIEQIVAAGSRRRRVTVVGGGATGLQYLFELRDVFRRAGSRVRLELVDGGETLLPDQPPAFHDYVTRRLEEGGIDYFPATRLRGVDGDRLVVAGPRGGRRELSSLASFVFAGLRGNPVFLDADESGRVLRQGQPLHRIFAAGDCCSYAGPGYDGRSAQAALRQGLHVASAIVRLDRGRRLPEYRSSELGFFLSLGALDGIGWVGTPDAVVTGVPAYGIREAIETRYDLFVAGVDTFRIL